MAGSKTKGPAKKQSFAPFDDVAALVLALRESRTGIPESYVYVALGMDLERYNSTRNLSVKAGLISVSGNFVELTEKGATLADQINAELSEK